MSKVDLKFGKYKPVLPTKLIKNEYFLEAVKYAFEQAGAAINQKYANYEDIRGWAYIGCDDEKIQFISSSNREIIDLDTLFNHVDFVWPDWATHFGYLESMTPDSYMIFYNEEQYAYVIAVKKKFSFNKTDTVDRGDVVRVATKNLQIPLPEVDKVYSVYNSDISEYFDAKVLSTVDGFIVGRWIEGPRAGELFDYAAGVSERKLFMPVASKEEKDFIQRASEILFKSDKKNSLAGLSKDLYDNGCRFVKKEEK